MHCITAIEPCGRNIVRLLYLIFKCVIKLIHLNRKSFSGAKFSSKRFFCIWFSLAKELTDIKIDLMQQTFLAHFKGTHFKGPILNGRFSCTLGFLGAGTCR